MALSSDEIKRHLLLGRKAMTNIDSILKSKDITLLTKVPIVKPMFFSLGSKITLDGDCSQEIKGCLLLGKIAMTNLDSVLKSRDIALPAKVCIVKAMVFPAVMYGCES